MPVPLLRALRATGADLPFGRPEAAHPGVALESWYWRFADADAGAVVLLSATQVLERDGEAWLSVVLAAQHADGTRSVVEAALGDVHAAPGALEVAATGRDGAWLRASATRVEADLGARGQLAVELERPWRWPRRSLGGLGLGHLVPRLSQYWHPHTLGGRARGAARFGARRVELDGTTPYGEKNWGRGGTPRAWWWGQAVCAEDVTVAFAGGVLDVGPARVPATALVVRVGDELAAFAPALALVTSEVAECSWRLDAWSPRWRARVRATATGAPFDLPVPVPGERRTAPLSHQHQDGALELVLWRDGRERFRGSSARAGVERGGRELERATG